jgi:PHP family Zn ribbon phosphoesterase
MDKQGAWIFRNGKYRCTICGKMSIYKYKGIETTPTPCLTKQCPSCGSDMKIALMQQQYLYEGE